MSKKSPHWRRRTQGKREGNVTPTPAWAWRQSESIFGEGVELRNGERTQRIPRDDLHQRSDRVLQAWIKSLPITERKKLLSYYRTRSE